jgi:MHS family proline/betaine transporter-like MFS transporter
MMAGMLLAVLLYIPIYKQMYNLADVSQSTQISLSNPTNSTSVNQDGLTVTTSRTERNFSDGNVVIETVSETEAAAGQEPVVASKKEINLSQRNFWWMVFFVFVQVIFVAMVYGPIAAFLVELFPTRIRYTSMSLPYHIGNGIFGGLTPLIATWLYELTRTESNPQGDPFAGLYYPIVVAAICFVIGMIFLSNKRRADVMS